jgi:AcrR family transcriptional regulator
MNNTPQKTPEKIINATIACIEKHGAGSVTVRMISEAAGVNIAAVNYHFHSKEKLFDNIIHFTIDHMIGDMEAFINVPDRAAKEILRDIIIYLIEGSARFPEITRMQFYETFMHNNFDTYANREINAYLSKLSKWIQERADIPLESITTALIRIFTTLFFVSIFPGFFKDFTGYKLQENDVTREAFIQDMINSLPF